MSEKTFKTYDEMIELLRSRNMNIPNGAPKRKAKIILQREGYYNIVNGYKRPFLSSFQFFLSVKKLPFQLSNITYLGSKFCRKLHCQKEFQED